MVAEFRFIVRVILYLDMLGAFEFNIIGLETTFYATFRQRLRTRFVFTFIAFPVFLTFSNCYLDVSIHVKLLSTRRYHRQASHCPAPTLDRLRPRTDGPATDPGTDTEAF